MRSFLLASAAFCLTCAFIGCDTPAEPAKTPPPVATPEPAKPPEGGKMEGPAPAPAPEKPKEEPPK